MHISESRVERLHLGCGLTAPDDWLNVDGSFQVVLARHPRVRNLLSLIGLVPRRQSQIPWPRNVRRLNVKKRLPFPDRHFAAIYSSHLLEHLPRDHARSLLLECRRVLRPSGVCRLVVPDLEYLINQYLEAKEGSKSGDDPAREFMKSLHMDSEPGAGSWLYRLYRRQTNFHAHKWMYDTKSLVLLFQEAGFDRVQEKSYLDSRIPTIEQVEDEARVINGAGICVEGIRPQQDRNHDALA